MEKTKKTKTIQVKIDATVLAFMRLECQLRNKSIDLLIEDEFKQLLADKIKESENL